jgi:hypothetical protein
VGSVQAASFWDKNTPFDIMVGYFLAHAAAFFVPKATHYAVGNRVFWQQGRTGRIFRPMAAGRRLAGQAGARPLAICMGCV